MNPSAPLGETSKLINEVRLARHQLANSVYGKAKEKTDVEDPGDALPIMIGRSVKDGSEVMPFRLTGFGKYRNRDNS